jgi:hypothetical protein
MPDNIAPGAPLVCPRCGNPGTYHPPTPTRAARPAKRRSGAPLIIFAFLVALCFGGVMALALPWPTLLLSFLAIAGAVVLMTGKVGREWSMRWPLAIGTAILSVLLGSVSGLRIVSDYEEQQRQEAEAQAAAEAEERRVNELRGEAADRIARARQHLQNAEQAIAELNAEPMAQAANEIQPLAELEPPPEGYAEVANRVRELNRRLNRTGAERHLQSAEGHADAGDWAEARMALNDASPYLTALGEQGSELRQRQQALQQRGSSFWAAADAIEAAETALDADHADAVAEENAYDSALAALEPIEGEALRANRRQVRRLTRRLRRARRRNHRAAERLRRSRAERQAQRDRCGPRPTLSAWDGAVIGAESFMQRQAHDPDSIDVERCTRPSLAVDADHCWLTTCSVLGRNAFGAMVRSRRQFEVRNRVVVSARRL